MSKETQAVNVTGRDQKPCEPGEFAYVQYGYDEPEGICGMNFSCPCGCGNAGMLMFNNYKIEGHPTWDWNGNEDKPTLKPSILRKSECKWHGFLTDGIFKEC